MVGFCNPSSSLIICQNGSQNWGKHFTYYYLFINIIKNTTQGQSDGRDADSKVWEKGHWASVPSPGVYLPAPPGVHLRASTSQHIQVFTNSEALWTPLCVHVKLFQSFPTLCDPMDHSPPGSSVHGILQARILEWIAIPFCKGSSWSRDQTHISYVFCTDRQVLYH